jgi:hypothetical protein
MPKETSERTLHILKDALPALQTPNTALVAAATTSGFELSPAQPLVETVEEGPGGEVKRQTVWSLRQMEVEFLPQFDAEKISTGEFVRRFRCGKWRAENPHHPIAYMAFMHETGQRLREKIKGNKPLVMVRRGSRIAFIPQGSDAATVEKIMAYL